MVRLMADPRVFLSYSRIDGEAFANQLRTRLLAEDVQLWRDREQMEGGRDWWLQITAAIDHVEFLVLVMTPAALASPMVRREWRYARQKGVAVYPVRADVAIDFDALPRWMRSVHFYDLVHEWPKFVADLQGRPSTVRVPFMVEDLPEDFVPRPRETEQLLQQLLSRDREEPVAITTALRGAGGFGKTALARALCHHEAIQNAFDDGILWITLGERPGDLTGRVEDLIFMLSGQRPGFAGIETAVAAFTELLAERELLIVIDDAWDAAHVWPFLQGGDRCARIITTRNAGVLPAASRRIEVDAMAADEALRLLTHQLPGPHGAACTALAQRLGEWPLLLKLVNGALRERVLHHRQPLAAALEHVNKALEKRGLTYFDVRDAGARSAAVATTLDLSLAQLSADERARFDELAVFPEDAEIPLATLAMLWGRTGALDEFDTESLCERLARLSLLLTLDLQLRYVRMHDVVRRYLLDRQRDQVQALHCTLVEAGRPAAGWHTLAHAEPYWWPQLFFHLQAAGLHDELLATALDLRWLSEKSAARTAFSAESDLRLAETLFAANDTLRTLRRVFGQSAHLFGDCRDAAEVRATLASRLPSGSVLQQVAAVIAEPRLEPVRPLPDLPHPALLRTLGNRREAVRACAISADGRIVATASADGATLWDCSTGTELRRLVASGETLSAGRSVLALDLSADGARLAAATSDRRLWVWDTASGVVVTSLSGHTDEVTDCALSADGHWLVSASLDETLKLWDTVSGELVHTLARTWASNEHGWLVPNNEQGHWAGVLACAVSADGRLAVSASSDQSLIVWDLDAGQALAVLTGHSSAVQACAFSPDGQRVASVGSDRSLRVWNWATREQRAVIAHAQVATSCAWSADGRHVVTSSADGSLRVWGGPGDELLWTFTGHADWVCDCAISASAGIVVSAGHDGTARLWRLEVHTEPRGQRQHDGAVLACAATPSGSHAFSAGQDQTVVCWETARGQARGRWHLGDAALRALAVCPDGALLAAGSEDRGLGLFSTSDGTCLTTLLGHRDAVNACAFDPGNTRLASVSNDRSVRLWDLHTRSRKLAWVAHEEWVQTCAFSPDGRWLATGSADGGLRLWDTHFDGALWEAWLTQPKPLPTLHAAEQLRMRELRGHDRTVNHCAFTPDGQHLVSASADRSLRLWRLHDGALVATLEGHLEDVLGFDITGDGRYLASVSHDGGILVWSLSDRRAHLALHVDGPLTACVWVQQQRLLAVGARGVYLLATANS